MTINEILEKFDGVKKQGAGWQARCPAHDDRKASLSQGKNGATVLYCHAGCGAKEVLAVVGLTTADLFAEPLKTRDDHSRKSDRANRRHV
ncbi:MAG TPA: hypothetical protein VNQ79_21430 [Blastocatellia bacterium]|nr:hypothetical protein [Blastocatellia bacterium]